ncbi:hypothetical protein FDG2_3306 [Candidatus Protofrankia californiensis]|uniref:Uncharacterized protein n=1 Tax=Candidatus Protofrankia californiensis TaxID=1839754 RepID=A0A1C3NZB3_9ACTN|nr:hypothetical protein FDG2_3306 [Candidatus Protofrankia californiensis]
MGRSPRGRGRPRRNPSGLPVERKIPARAGTTTAQKRDRIGRGEDPRAGGDDATPPCGRLVACGRSPRGRGRLIGRLDGRELTRKIPARAGTTTVYGDETGTGGDDIMTAQEMRSTFGRSPRGRGRRQHRRRLRHLHGKIPARAGTTSFQPDRVIQISEDPRAGGDDPAGGVWVRMRAGRSPRGRGRRHDAGGRHRCDGKIPARAGTTCPGAPCITGGPEDPRAGGDDPGGRRQGSRDAGRSPRGRGRHQVSGRPVRGLGKIPARAGTTAEMLLSAPGS